MSAELRTIALARLLPSMTTAQVARRASFDQVALAELAESIKSVGLIAPIVARPDPQFADCYQIVAGERRYLAATKAGLEQIDVSVRDLTDEQVLEVQLIENLQREGLHPLHEAEGYEQLMKLHGHRADELADKIGKSKRYVYARIQLLQLCKDGRKAFYDGKLNASTALYISRIPVESLQKEALKEITAEGYDGTVMTARAAEKFVQERYMLKLAGAPFDTGTDNYVPGAKRCGLCPKNTNSQPELFGDVKSTGAGVCTDPTCFQSKTRRAIEIRLEEAQANGQSVIEGKKAKAIFPYGTHEAHGGFIKLDGSVWAGGKSIKVSSLISKDVQPTLVKVKDDYDGGAEKVVEVVPDSAVRQALKEKGVNAGSVATDSHAAYRRAQDKKQKREAEYRRELFKAVVAKVPERLERKDLDAVALAFFEDIWHDTRVKVVAALGWNRTDADKKLGADVLAAREIPKLAEAELSQFLFGLTIAKDLNVSGYSTGKPKGLLAAAQRFKVNADALRKELAAAEKVKAKKAPAKAAATKKAARKPK